MTQRKGPWVISEATYRMAAEIEKPPGWVTEGMMLPWVGQKDWQCRKQRGEGTVRGSKVRKG